MLFCMQGRHVSGDMTHSKLVPNSSGEQQLVLSAAQLLSALLHVLHWHCQHEIATPLALAATRSRTRNLNTTKLWWIYFHLHKNLINKNVLFLVFIYANLINFNVSWFSS